MASSDAVRSAPALPPVAPGLGSLPPRTAAAGSGAPGTVAAPIGVSGLSALRARVWAVMDDPTSSRAAQLVAGGILAVILVSCTAFVLQTLPQYAGETSAEFAGIELACVIIFSVEFALRVSCTPSLARFAASPLNVVDFLAILPFYVEVRGVHGVVGDVLFAVINGRGCPENQRRYCPFEGS